MKQERQWKHQTAKSLKSIPIPPPGGPRLTIATQLLAEYESLPVSVSPKEFIEGWGNWGLTEQEYRKAMEIAKKIVLL